MSVTEKWFVSRSGTVRAGSATITEKPSCHAVTDAIGTAWRDGLIEVVYPDVEPDEKAAPKGRKVKK